MTHPTDGTQPRDSSPLGPASVAASRPVMRSPLLGSPERSPSASPRRSLSPSTTVSGRSSRPRGPTRREEYLQRVREALTADYTTLHRSPLCELPGVVALAQSEYQRRIFPAAAALRVLLDRAIAAALAEVERLKDKRAQQTATYLRLATQCVPVTEITRQLGLHSRSYVHTAIQRPALELITEAFLQLARQPEQATGRQARSPQPS